MRGWAETTANPPWDVALKNIKCLRISKLVKREKQGEQKDRDTDNIDVQRDIKV